MSNIVQYVVVRGDLIKVQKWPLGALIAQACHASSAAIHLHYKSEETQEYLADLDRMHKVVLEAKDEASLSELAKTLSSSEIDHKLWVEQPENYPTCLATRPYRKDVIQQYFKPFKLFK